MPVLPCCLWTTKQPAMNSLVMFVAKSKVAAALWRRSQIIAEALKFFAGDVETPMPHHHINLVFPAFIRREDGVFREWFEEVLFWQG